MVDKFKDTDQNRLKLVVMADKIRAPRGKKMFSRTAGMINQIHRSTASLKAAKPITVDSRVYSGSTRPGTIRHFRISEIRNS